MTIHRFIHLGDLHLGPNSRNADRRRALDQAIAEGRELPGLAAWLFPGDLNHGRMTIDDRNWLITRVRMMAEAAPLFIVPGNHDLPGDLDFLPFLDTEHPVYLRTRPDVIRAELPTGVRLSLFMLPYPTRAGLVAAGVAPAGVVDAAAHALDVLFMDAAAKLEAARAQGDITLMIGHVNVGGSIASSGQPQIGREIELNPLMLERLGRCYKGLNHIHRAQAVGGAVYAGSMCRLDYGEVEDKSYVEVRYQQDWSGAWDYHVVQHPLDVAPMYHIEGDLTREGFDWHVVGESNGAEQGGPGFFEGAEVRVRYRYNADEAAELDRTLVSAPFDGALRLELDPIAVRNRAARVPAVAQARTLDEKIAAFVAHSGQTWDDALAAKLADLQQPDGAAVLTQVQQRVARATAPAELVEVPL